MPIQFHGSPRPTLGVEVELQVIDPETRKLTPGVPAILARFSPDDPRFKPELIQSNIEINTGICSNVDEVRKDLTQRLDALMKVCDELGYQLASSGTHPFSLWSEQLITENQRYIHLVERFAWAVRRLTIFGLHVHVGVENGEKAIGIVNTLSNYLPHLLALSASSPFWVGQDTGLYSSRVKIFELLPLAGLPHRLVNWSEFQRFMRVLLAAKTIETVREIWWDVRPHPGLGTVEVRICDALPRLTEVMVMTAFIQSLVVWIGDQYDAGEELRWLPTWVIAENKWRAARWGPDAEIIDDAQGTLCTLSEAILKLVEMVTPTARRLNCDHELRKVSEILKSGPSTRRQRSIYDATHSYSDVVDALVKELKSDQVILA